MKTRPRNLRKAHKKGRGWALLPALLLAIGLAAWAMLSGAPQERQPKLGLFTTLPLYWNEAGDLSEMLNAEGPLHWVRGLIEERRELQPLDVLTSGVGGIDQGGASLGAFRDLLLAQPRGLSAAENVALDNWVRGGGHLLLFADPLMTAHSRFAIGDRRRPQDVVLLSPILGRWGLELHFDEGQLSGEHMVAMLGVEVPVDLPGRFTLLKVAGDGAVTCKLLGNGAAANCVIGSGRVLIMADAALLDGHGADQSARAQALSRMMAVAYDTK